MLYPIELGVLCASWLQAATSANQSYRFAVSLSNGPAAFLLALSLPEGPNEQFPDDHE